MNPSQLNPDLTTGGALDNGVLKKPKNFENEDPNDSGDDSDGEKPARRSGRRKIKIEYIEDKNRRHITFSKRKAGIMKKAYELSTLTGTQVLLLVVSETGLVYTFTTVKLQPIVTKPEGKNLIQACLNAPDPISADQSNAGDASYNSNASPVDEKKIYEETKKIEAPTATNSYGVPPSSAGYQSQGYSAAPQAPTNQMPVPNSAYSGHPGYMGSAPQYQQSPQQQSAPPPQQQQQQPQQQAQQQPQQPSPYGQIPQPQFYGNQQPHYMSHQQQPPPHPGYWQPGAHPPPNAPLPRQDQRNVVDDKSRVKK